MKKILLSLSIITLLAAGCNSTANQQPQTNNQTTPTIPTGAETSYGSVLNAVMQKCGDNVQPEYYFSQKNPNLNNQQVDTYSFTAGTCGNDNQLINVYYNRSTQQISVDAGVLNNTNNLLQPFPIADWNINYSQAVSKAMATGGQDFLNKNTGAQMSIAGLAYRQNQPFEWQVIFKSADGSNQLTVSIDPKTGDVISKQ